MARNHFLYWLSDDDGNEIGSFYYKRDAVRFAKKYAKLYACDIYINYGEDIVGVEFCPCL